MGDLFLYLIITFILLVLLTAAIAGWRAAPYVPTLQRDVRRMLRLAEVQPNELVIDLGAGDGRFLITAAHEFGARAVGYEISLLPFLIARVRIYVLGLKNTISVHYKDFYTADLSHADVVTCFLTPMAMKRLEPKFQQELKPGCRVVSYAFRLPHRAPTTVDKPTSRSTPVFLYRFDQRADIRT